MLFDERKNSLVVPVSRDSEVEREVAVCVFMHRAAKALTSVMHARRIVHTKTTVYDDGNIWQNVKRTRKRRRSAQRKFSFGALSESELTNHFSLH